MFPEPKRLEIDHRTIKFLVGVIALSLATLASLLSGPPPIESVSASYHEGGLARDVFVGSLFAIAAFLAAYNGMSRRELMLSKVAAVAALLVAVFPCGCGIHVEAVRYVHAGSAAIMFVVLVLFCFTFRGRALAKGHPQANMRAVAYTLCGGAIALSIAVIALDYALGGKISSFVPRLTFYGENVALVAFGIAWLSASRVLPLISSEEERFSPFTSRERC
jgi:hypothetical protein